MRCGMRKKFLLAVSLSLVGMLFVRFAQASVIPVGYISYDVTGLNIAQFDISNQTGPNSSTFPDPTFPVTTSVSLTSLSLLVDYTGGATLTFGPSYFTLSPDGLSFDGTALSTLAGPSTNGLNGAISATLTGLFSTTSFTLNDGSAVTVDSSFSSTITDPAGPLGNGGLAIINATSVTSGPPPVVPEPSTLVMFGTGLLGFAGMARRKVL